MDIEKIVHQRSSIIKREIDCSLVLEKSIDIFSPKDLKNSINSLEVTLLGKFSTCIYKVINFVIKIFNKNFNHIDKLFEENSLAKRLIQNYTSILKDPNTPIDDVMFVHDISIERLKKSLPQAEDKPLKITMVGGEYAGLVKQGGLAEALEGLSRGLVETENEVRLIFPKYSSLPAAVVNALPPPETHVSSSGEEYKVYSKKIDGVLCQFIEHPSFELGGKNPSVYGPDYCSQANRFATFSSLAAELIYEQKDTDIIHLHDWHVAGVGLKLKNDHEEEWNAGVIPPIVFTFHNNQRAMQGRLSLGAYSYDPVVKGYQDHKIVRGNDNLFVRTLLQADAVTTVSKTFGLESQHVDRGEGISFAVRQAARIGKMTGILNGANLNRWDPKTDPMLCNWTDVDTNEQINLSYSASDPHLMRQKTNVRVQLQKWTAKYAPEVKVDFSKPLVTFIGRFDSRQKGIDRLEAGIEATLKKGGQFICMGTDEDEISKEILDKLQEKYKQGVFFIRDSRDSSGKLVYQQGNRERPGIGSLIRAATDFIYIPSKFEPCGLVQFEGWQFGSLAIGARTGGLADSIKPGNGYLFTNNPRETVEEALETWQKLGENGREELTRKVMTDVLQSGWKETASQYNLVYANALKQRQLRQVHSLPTEELKWRIRADRLQTTSAEEDYLSATYIQNKDSQQLSIAYEKLPLSIRADVPSPYGRHINFTKHEQLGSFPDGRFVLSAPNAKKVELILSNSDETQQQVITMAKKGGHWTAQLDKLELGQKYQYRIDGKIKLDPYARGGVPSKDANKAPYSIVCHSTHKWDDKAWIDKRQLEAGKSSAMSIYEVHLHSWKKQDGKALNYRTLANELVAHCKKQNYTHVELMGILEHPHDVSWGYQVTGYFAPTSRMGSLDDFKYLVDLLHQNEIGVFLDFVPAHFASEPYGLSNFDGSHQYDAHGLNYFLSVRNWFFKFGSKHFDYQSKEVREFLISSAMYWIQEMHIDGIRVDCVRSMISSENPASSNLFMRDLNATIHTHGQGAISIAEDYSGERNLTASPSKEGFDFDMKWHTAMNHHIMNYFRIPANRRKLHYNMIKDAIDADNFHKQILFMSHDQAKAFHNLNKSIKDPKTREAQTRAFLSLMMCLPGKKLNFMATEGTSPNIWNGYPVRKDKGWFDENPSNPRILAMIEQLNKLYKNQSVLHEFDSNGTDLEWIPDASSLIHAYRRKNSENKSFVFLHNFTDQQALVPMKGAKEIFNSDALEFGGAGRTNSDPKGVFKIPPLTTLILEET